jgi:hypothetical protein
MRLPGLKPTSDAAYRVYHDALRAFRRRHDDLKRQRTARTHPDAAAAAMSDEDNEHNDDYYIANNMVEDSPEMVAADVQFLASLREACWAAVPVPQSPSTSLSEESFTKTQKEGNLWDLLAQLRQLSADAVFWEVTNEVKVEMERFYHHVSQLSVEETPRSVLGRLDDTSDKSRVPLMLKRRKTILKWLESIFARIVPERTQWPNRGALVFPPKGLPTTTKDRELFSISLALFLSGRFEEAKQLARDLGTPWRAAAWSGDDPHGYVMDGGKQIVVGNDQRPLWRRMMWLQSEHLSGTSPSRAGTTAASPEEGALAALLACHLDNALSNPALRTWEKGLSASLRCVWGRTEDEILYLHNQARSIHCEALFTTASFSKHEEDHLNNTKRYESLDEARILDELQASGFVQMRSRDVFTDATASVLAGQDPLFLYLIGCMKSVDGFAAEQVRFLTHLVLYLNSLCPVSSTGPEESQEQLEEWKNFLVEKYLGLLAERERLSGLFVLYSSFLPKDAVLTVLPRLLCQVANSRERGDIVDHLLQFMPDLDLEVLTRVVDAEMRLDEPAALTAGEASENPLPRLSDVPTRMDMRKIKSIEWLCFHPKHKNTALGFANLLLRSFFLRDKLGCAAMFIREYLPPDIADPVDEAYEEQGATLSDEQAAAENRGTLVDMRSEHVAFKRYLEAMSALQHFDQSLTTDFKTQVLDDRFDALTLDPTVAEVARAVERRQFIEDKRKSSSVIVKAARAAMSSLLDVLKHPGGWLTTETPDPTVVELRRKFLPQVVSLYLHVCEKAADWMASSSDDAMAKLGCPDAASALRSLDDAGDAGPSPLNPAYWTDKALRSPVVVADCEYAVDSAMTVSQVEDFLRKLAEIQIQHLKYVFDEPHR